MANVELLAPVGSSETFRAAIDGGADAVYVGAPGFNARNLARDLRLEEIAAMIRFSRTLGKKVYVAANSLIVERELPLVIETLTLLQELQPDGLIVQDLGLIKLARDHFPKLPLHASTLMLAHNSDAVHALAQLGCRRVVLARELTVKEIASIAIRRGDTELEVFIHGAMCFSYSGLCMFSSYLGGKSGLRGRCVQPCRRAYRLSSLRGKSHGQKIEPARYLFSMNDLSGLEVLPALVEAGITSLKIEGRLRSAHYVKSVVGAYRMVLDALPEDQERAILSAKALIDQAMSRKTSPGYFLSPQPAEAITPFHSGNMGIHLGRFTTIKMVGTERICRFVLKGGLAVGDRLRLHQEPTGERRPFRLRTLFVGGDEQGSAVAGTKVSIPLPDDFQPVPGGHVEVYKIDAASDSGILSKDVMPTVEVARELMGLRKQLAKQIAGITSRICGSAEYHEAETPPGKGGGGKRPKPTSPLSRKATALEWWLKTDSLKVVTEHLPFTPDRLLLCFDKQLLNQTGKIKSTLGNRVKMVVWALPPIIMESELAKLRTQVSLLIRSGFRSFQISHFSQIALFGSERVHLFADCTFNLMNSQAIALLGELGISKALASSEMDREAITALLAGCKRTGKDQLKDREEKNIPVGLTVYGAPALYSSRLAANHFQFDRQIESPKNEKYVIRKKDGLTQTFPERPYSLLPYLGELRQMGMKYVVVDISGGQLVARNIQELQDRLANNGRYGKLSTFNYLGKLE